MTEKEQAIREVIWKRVECLYEIIKRTEDDKAREYYKGKKDGLMQAYSLIGETLASIRVELTPTDTNRA